jgi:hypothetical protein
MSKSCKCNVCGARRDIPLNDDTMLRYNDATFTVLGDDMTAMGDFNAWVGAAINPIISRGYYRRNMIQRRLFMWSRDAELYSVIRVR